MSDHSQERFRKISARFIDSVAQFPGSVNSPSPICRRQCAIHGSDPFLRSTAPTRTARRAQRRAPAAAAAAGGPAPLRPGRWRPHARAVRRRSRRRDRPPWRSRPRRGAARSEVSAVSAASTRVATRSSTADRSVAVTSVTQRSSTARSCSSPRMPTTHTVSSRPTSPPATSPATVRPGARPANSRVTAERDPEPEARAEDHHQLRLQPPRLQRRRATPRARRRRWQRRAPASRVRSRHRRGVW